MIKLQKKFFPLVLLGIINSLAARHSYAQNADTEDTDIVTTQDNNLKIKIKGEITTKAMYTSMYHDEAKDFSPSCILFTPATTQKSIGTSGTFGGGLTLEKPLMLGSDVMRFVVSGSAKKDKVSLKKAYIDAKYFTVGYTNSNFCNPAAMINAPSDIDAKAVQVKWTHQPSTHFSYAVAIEETLGFKTGSKDGLDKDDDKEQATNTFVSKRNIPTLSVGIKCQGEFGHVYLGTLGRSLDYYHEGEKKSYASLAGGVNLATKLKLIPKKATLKAQGIYGAGIGEYVNGLNMLTEKGIQETNTAYYTDENKPTLTLINTWGVGGRIKYCLTPKLSAAITYSFLTILEDTTRNENAFQASHYASLGFIHKPIKHLKLGLNGLSGFRNNINKASKYAYRVQTNVTFCF